MTLPDSSQIKERDAAILTALRAGIPDLLAAYRYGSAGSVYEHADSDIDLAVLTRMPLGFDQRCHLSDDLARLTGRDVDLNDMRRLPVSLRVQIVTGGVRLYAADIALADDYDSRVLSDYARLNEERRFILEDVRQRGSIHG